MKKVRLTVPWGQFDPIVKNSTTLHVWVSDYFTYSFIICRSNFYTSHWLHNHLLCYCTHYRWVWFSCPLIWDKWHLTHPKTPEHRYTTIPTILPLRYAPHVTEHHKRKNYLYYMEGTVGSICPLAEINGKTQNLANVCDIARKALRKIT